MRVFLIKRVYLQYDEYGSAVVKAENEERAREVAIEFSSDFDDDDFTIEEIHIDDKEEVVHSEFNAG